MTTHCIALALGFGILSSHLYGVRVSNPYTKPANVAGRGERDYAPRKDNDGRRARLIIEATRDDQTKKGPGPDRRVPEPQEVITLFNYWGLT